MRHASTIRRLFAVVSLALVLGTLPAVPGAPLSVSPPPANAHITAGTNTTQAATSIVNCIQSSAAFGQGHGFNPRFVTSCYASLWDFYDYSDSTGGTGNALSTDTAMLTFGDTKDAQGNDSVSEWLGDPIATVSDVGSVYGLAYSTGENPNAPASPSAIRVSRTFAAAYTKRVTRYGDSGPGAIYVRTNTSPPTIARYVTIPSVVPGPATDATLNMGGSDWNGTAFTAFKNGDTATTARLTTGGIHKLRDQQSGTDYSGAWGAGRTSLGDLEIDENERFLYAVNLNQKAVYQIDTWSASPQSTVRPLTSLIWAAGVPEPCTGGSGNGAGGRSAYRPFALAHRGGYLYVGAVCSGEVEQWRSHLRARVDRIAIDANGAWGTWQNVLAEFSLFDFTAQRNN
ncbi:MAG: Serine-aspartate repeat-containing protein precursor, partial [Chloroflexota bacterium]